MLNREQTAKKLRDDYDYYGSWGVVAARYGLTKALIYRTALRGYEPKKPRIREVLEMSALVPTPACVKCGDVHTLGDICPTETPVRIIVQKPPRPRRPRLAIRLDDPHSAARSIRRHMTKDNIKALLLELSNSL